MNRKKIRYFYKYFKNIRIGFDDVFDGEDFKDYRDFVISLTSKKVYSKIADMIIEENNNILNTNVEAAEKFLWKYYCIGKGIASGIDNKINTRENFINTIITELFNHSMLDVIKKYVKKRINYSVNEKISNNSTNTNKHDPGTTFADIHFEMLYMISAMARLIIPLITHYIYLYNIDNEADDFILLCMKKLFNLTRQYYGDIDIYTKLRVYIDRYMRKNYYNDRYLWEDIKLFGQTIENSSEDILTKILNNKTPQFKFDQNIIHLISVVVRKSISVYTLRKQHPYNIMPINMYEGAEERNDNVVNMVEFSNSSSSKKRDEYTIILRDYFAQDTIDKIKIRNNIEIDKKELDYYTKTVISHDFQENAIISSFYQYFSGIENIYGSCNKRNYCELMLILSKMLEKLGVGSLCKYLTGIKIFYNMKRMSKLFINTIENDDRYNKIIEGKYSNVGSIVKKRDPVKNNVSILINNTYHYNIYNEQKTGTVIENEPFEIINSVLDFMSKIII